MFTLQVPPPFWLCRAVSQQTQNICITFVQHCTNVIQMFCVYWDTVTCLRYPAHSDGSMDFIAGVA